MYIYDVANKVMTNIVKEQTPEEITAMQKEAEVTELMEKSRPLTTEEVTAMLITEQINTLQVDDNTALRMITYYPEWKENISYSIGYKVQYKGQLYKVIQAHTSQAGWNPEETASLFTVINKTHAGTREDAIPYKGNMVLEKDKYYYDENYIIYLCIRDSINPVYNPLSELVGVYVEVV